MILSTLARLLLSSCSIGAQEAAAGFDFQGLGTQELASRGLSTEEGGVTFEGLLGRDEFASIALGSFDLWVPVEALKEARRLAQFRSACLTLLAVEEEWHGWLLAGQIPAEEAADREAVRQWIKAWSKGEFAKARGGPLLETIKTKDKVVEAAGRMSTAHVYDEMTAASVGQRNQIVFGPSRREFLQLVSLAGVLHPKEQAALWDPKVLERTSAWLGWCQICCFENVDMPVDVANPYTGVAMDQRSPTSFEQFIADRVAAILVRKEFNRQGTHFFEEALGMNLVLGTVGRNNLYGGDWKIETRWTGETTQPYERFVPGGNPAGGTLPPRKAGMGFMTSTESEMSRYRKNEGEGYFLASLRGGQEAGRKLAKKTKDQPLRDDPLAHFELYSLETHRPWAVSAPFLGEFAEKKTLPPNEFLDDYEDFFRAYRAAFLHWLEENGSPDPESSRKKFSELIQAHKNRDPSKPFHEVVKEVYGIPLSHSSDEVDSLEWRFLAFLDSGD
jgi:hypothetical protein